jgi:hypothetical protein
LATDYDEEFFAEELAKPLPVPLPEARRLELDLMRFAMFEINFRKFLDSFHLPVIVTKHKVTGPSPPDENWSLIDRNPEFFAQPFDIPDIDYTQEAIDAAELAHVQRTNDLSHSFLYPGFYRQLSGVPERTGINDPKLPHRTVKKCLEDFRQDIHSQIEILIEHYCHIQDQWIARREQTTAEALRQVRLFSMDWINCSIMHWTCTHRAAATFHRFVFWMMWFPHNLYTSRIRWQYLISHYFPLDQILWTEVDAVRGERPFFQYNISDLVWFWRYGHRLMIFSPAKVVAALDEVILTRWLVLIKDHIQQCPGFGKHCHAQTIMLVIHYLSLGVISQTARSMTEIVFSFETLAGLFDCLSIGEKPPEVASLLKSADVITGCPDSMSPLEITDSSTEEQRELVIATSRFYQALGLYLEHCALIMRIVGIRSPVRDFEVKTWCAITMLARMMRELGMSCHALPPLEFFQAKLDFVLRFQLDENGLIPPSIDFPAPPPAPTTSALAVRGRSRGRAKAPKPLPTPKPPGSPPLTRATMEIAFRRRAKGRSLADSLTGAFEELRDATTDQVITAETGMVGLADVFRDCLVLSYNSLSDLWRRNVEEAGQTAGEPPIPFVVEIVTSLFPVPVIRLGSWR